VQISHSGTIAGLIFDERFLSVYGAGEHGIMSARGKEQLRSLGVRLLSLFTTGADSIDATGHGP
jgi:hypothetical protein